MNPDWHKRVLELKHQETDAEAREYVALVYQALWQVTPEVAKTLMATFIDEPDYGVQESVVSVLASAPPAIYQRALLEELPRLLKEAPEWADVLVGREVEHRPLTLVSLAREINPDIQEALLQLLTKPSFADFYPNAKEVAQALRG